MIQIYYESIQDKTKFTVARDLIILIPFFGGVGGILGQPRDRINRLQHVCFGLVDMSLEGSPFQLRFSSRMK